MMKTHDGYIKYNDEQCGYGMMGYDGKWVKEKLENGDRIDVVINGERFATNFEGAPRFPALKPHSWDNWEFLSGLPAAYLDFEKTSKKPLTEKEKRWLRYGTGLAYILVSLAVSAVLGALIALIGFKGNAYLKSFIDASIAAFLFFGAGCATGGALLIGNILPENLCVGFGCALYYGTILLTGFLSNFIYGADFNRYCVSFVIVSLVCYIVWLKEFKSQKTE